MRLRRPFPRLTALGKAQSEPPLFQVSRWSSVRVARLRHRKWWLGGYGSEAPDALVYVAGLT